jgi:hypothetical protein
LSRFDESNFDVESSAIMADVSFPRLRPPTNVQAIMDDLSDRTKIKSLSPNDIREYSILLAAYNFYLCSEENKLRSYVNWCEGNIKHIVGLNMAEVDGYGFHEKDHKIRSCEPNAAALSEKKLAAEIKLNHLSFLGQKLQFLIESLKGMGYEKARERYTS